MKQAFTLIELLVVVLIMGILSAVALPRYQSAVKKARHTQKIVSANAMVRLVTEYYLANGVYPANWDDLGVEKPLGCNGWIDDSNEYTFACGLTYRVHLGANGQVAVRYCYATANNESENRDCKLFTGLTEPTYPFYSGNYHMYRYY